MNDKPIEKEENGKSKETNGLLSWLPWFKQPSNGEATVRETLEELIEEIEESDETETPIDDEQRTLLGNILHLREKTIADVMVPRADIIAADADMNYDEVTQVIVKEGHSRVPVYRESLDNILGMVHIKDLLAVQDQENNFQLENIVRRPLFVSPAMRVLELLLEMRTTRVHMALVVDEYGGTDGLVTIEDLVEEIVGEIEDEHDTDHEPEMIPQEPGIYDADARVTLETFEHTVGDVITEEEREDIDTLGGLVFDLAGRVPGRGELIAHSSGWEFEVLEADPRRIYRLRIRGPKSIKDLKPES
ncbi:MAG: hemolysin family protein [Rhodospirillales bacterium]|nr:hemolysin family protein [Rhodospirillales bacterium]